MPRLLTAVLLLAAGLAAAQDASSDKRAQIASLNGQEKAAMDAVTANSSLSKADSNAAKRRIHADYKAKKDAIRAQMKADRQSKRADAQVRRKDSRAAVQQRRGPQAGGK